MTENETMFLFHKSISAQNGIDVVILIWCSAARTYLILIKSQYLDVEKIIVGLLYNIHTMFS